MGTQAETGAKAVVCSTGRDGRGFLVLQCSQHTEGAGSGHEQSGQEGERQGGNGRQPGTDGASAGVTAAAGASTASAAAALVPSVEKKNFQI